MTQAYVTAILAIVFVPGLLLFVFHWVLHLFFWRGRR